MNNFTKYFFFACLSLFFTNSLSAQFYTEDFGDMAAATANWTSGGTNPGSESWTYWTDPSNPTFGSQPDFASPTVANGFFQFNSDANGNNQHDITLTGPAIDCSAQPVVIASFSSQYAFFTTSGTEAFLGVSTDGTNFEYFPILTNVEQNALSAAVQNSIVDISSVAANQPAVFLQFRWVGNFEYAWKIDDVALSATDPTPANELVIGVAQHAPNFFQPLDQAQPVTFQFTVQNLGAAPQTNVVALGEIISDGNTIWSSTTTLNQLDPGADSLILLPETFLPTVEGSYTMQYTVTQNETDVTVADNTTSSTFEIAAGIFSKDDGNIVNANRPAGITDVWEIGNLYFVPNAGSIATTAIFSVASPAATPTAHQGQSVTVKLYQVTEDDDASDFTEDDLTLVGLGLHEFTTEENFALVTTTLEDLNTGEDGVVLNADTEYILTIAYGPEMNAPFSTVEYPLQFATVVKTDEWFLRGFGADFTVLARMGVSNEIVSSTQDVELTDDNSIEIFPNPVSDVLTLDVSLAETTAQGIIRIVSASGQLIHKSVKENLKSDKIEINVAQYPAGAYLIHLSTDNGVKTKRFVVTK